MSNCHVQVRAAWTEATVNCIMGYNKQSSMEKGPKEDHTNHFKKRMMQILKPHIEPEKPNQTGDPSSKDSDRP